MKFLHPESPLFVDLVRDEYFAFPDITLLDNELFGAAEKYPEKTIIVSNLLEPTEVVAKCLCRGVFSVLQRNKNHFAADLQRIGSYLQNPEVYFSQPFLQMKDDNVSSCEISFSNPLHKPNLKRETEKFLENIQYQNVLESAEAVIEEFYMNAMLDAPSEAAKLGQVNCTYDLGLHAMMRMTLTKDRLIISCEDPFGSLDVKKFTKRMSEVYVNGAGESINFREGGAGLGCVIIFEHCEALYLGVSPGQKTLVTAVIPVGMSYRQRSQVKKSLHLIVI